MGGVAVIHEPDSMGTLKNCLESYQVFRDAGWIEYFQKLVGLDEAAAIEFAQNLNNHQTRVRGLQIEVKEEVIT